MIEKQLPATWAGKDRIFEYPDARERILAMISRRGDVRRLTSHREVLTAAQARIFSLYYDSAQSEPQIAKLLGMRRNSVNEHLRRARQRILHHILERPS